MICYDTRENVIIEPLHNVQILNTIYRHIYILLVHCFGESDIKLKSRLPSSENAQKTLKF